jgi:hypothetical protein
MLKFLVGKSADDKVNDAKTSLVEEPPQKVVVFRKDLVITVLNFTQPKFHSLI